MASASRALRVPVGTLRQFTRSSPATPIAHFSTSSSARENNADPVKSEVDHEEQSSPYRNYGGPFREMRGASMDPHSLKRPPQEEIENALFALAKERGIRVPDSLQDPNPDVRLPRAVQALYLAPLRHKPTHGIPVAQLQLRSYSVRNVEFMADFAMRAAYYLGLPARGPVPLPRITQRWTVPRDVFIFKKSMENFERVTLRRLVQIQDGHPDVVQQWLTFLRKWQWYGVGMKANVFEFEDMDVLKRMDNPSDTVLQAGMESVQWDLIGRKKGLENTEEIGQWAEERGLDVKGALQAQQRARELAANTASPAVKSAATKNAEQVSSGPASKATPAPASAPLPNTAAPPASSEPAAVKAAEKAATSAESPAPSPESPAETAPLSAAAEPNEETPVQEPAESAPEFFPATTSAELAKETADTLEQVYDKTTETAPKVVSITQEEMESKETRAKEEK